MTKRSNKKTQRNYSLPVLHVEDLKPPTKHTFLDKAGRVIAVSAIVGFTLLGPVMPQTHAKDLSNGISPVSTTEDVVLTGDCTTYTCYVEIPCVVYVPCTQVQVPCAYGIYLPEL